MIWPFQKRHKPANKDAEISELRRKVSSSRDELYSNLFELDKASNALDDMVKRSLALLESPKK